MDLLTDLTWETLSMVYYTVCKLALPAVKSGIADVNVIYACDASYVGCGILYHIYYMYAATHLGTIQIKTDKRAHFIQYTRCFFTAEIGF